MRYLHHQRARYSDGQVVVRLGASYRDGLLTVPQALRRIINAIGIPTAETPSDLEELSALFRSVTADTRVAILLTDAAASSDLGLLLPTSLDAPC